MLQFHQGSLEALAFSPAPLAAGRLAGTRVLAAGGKDGKVSLWDIWPEGVLDVTKSTKPTLASNCWNFIDLI